MLFMCRKTEIGLHFIVIIVYTTNNYIQCFIAVVMTIKFAVKTGGYTNKTFKFGEKYSNRNIF